MRQSFPLVLPLMVLLTAAGCQRNESGVPQAVATQYQSKLLSAAAPANALSVTQVRAQLANSAEPNTPQSVVITGTLGKMPNPFHKGNEHPQFPWVEGAASFFLVDDATVEEFTKHGHAKGEECSFCLDMAGRRADKVALVQIRQPDGEPVPYRADALLGLKEGDHLVIEGTASLIMETMLVVTPTSIHEGPAPNQPATSTESSDSSTEQAPASAE